ncbi:plasmid mobilization protein [Roseomonas mucosa]|uniref:plasmid mobilization protein n=1 Tax=Roseomonas mucosa TaxID=207340 RepID=UPI0036F1D61D
MARPKKAPEERRDDRLNPRLTAAERAEIERAAAVFGITPSEFMRRRALGYRMPPSLAAQRQTATLATALLRIGVNLNQLTHRANAGREPPPDYLRDLATRIAALLDGLYGPGNHGGRAEL